MKATLEFNLPSETIDFNMAKQGTMATSVIFEMSFWLRDQLEDPTMNLDEAHAYKRVLSKLHELAQERGVRYEDASNIIN